MRLQPGDWRRRVRFCGHRGLIVGKRRRARECALQMLFQMDVSSEAAKEVFSGFFAERKVNREVRERACRLVRFAADEHERIDRLIREAADHWRLERMSRVDLSILRLALGEMIGDPSVPKNVVMDEAIEIAKRFSSQEAAAFINGILDSAAEKISSCQSE